MLQLLPQKVYKEGRSLTRWQSLVKRWRKTPCLNLNLSLLLQLATRCFMVYANGCGKGKGTHISVFTKTGAVNVELLFSKIFFSKHELVFTEIPIDWLLEA